jgi:hypothetical protein
MIMIMMIMTVASVDQRPGWGEHVKNPWSLWCSLHGWKNHGKKMIFQQAMAVATRFVR